MMVMKALYTHKGVARKEGLHNRGMRQHFHSLLLGFALPASEELLWALHLLQTKASSALSLSKDEESMSCSLLTEVSNTWFPALGHWLSSWDQTQLICHRREVKVKKWQNAGPMST